MTDFILRPGSQDVLRNIATQLEPKALVDFSAVSGPHLVGPYIPDTVPSHAGYSKRSYMNRHLSKSTSSRGSPDASNTRITKINLQQHALNE